MTKTAPQKASLYAWIVWLIGALFFYFAYILRVSPESISQFIANSHSDLTGDDVVNYFATAFLIPYVIMQLPVGILIDRFGARRIVSLGLLMVGISQLIFVTSGHIEWMIGSRILLGIAASFAFISAIRLATIWFPPHQLGMLAGLTQAMGMVGASVQRPLFEDLFFGYFQWTWQGVFWGFSIFFMALSALAWLIIRDRSDQAKATEDKGSSSFLQQFWVVIKHPQTWFVGSFAGMLYVPLILLGEVMGKKFFITTQSWVMDVGQVQAEWGAKLAILFIFWGFTVGGFIIGAWSDSMKKRRPFLLWSALVSLVLVTVVVYLDLSIYLELFMTCLMGIALGGLVVAYAMSGEIHRSSVTGVSIGLVNAISVLFGTLLVPAVTVLLKSYSVRDVFIIIPIAMIIAIVLSFFIKETNCLRYEQRAS
ncbi:MAG: MFS transporter [Candidatus Comchoanobacterales bacterium]